MKFSYILELSKKLSDELEIKEIRQLSATLIKNIITKEPYINKYINEISLEMKELIKNNILSTLASPLIEIRKAAALTVAGICKIEIPLGQWINIFDVFISTSQNKRYFFRINY